MTRLLAPLAACALLLSAAAPGAPRPPARVLVSADEFSLTLSRLTIRSGPAIVELANFGEDGHDLVLRRQAEGAPTLRIPEVAPGAERALRAKLAPGRFKLWCSIGDHRERGMVATLTVAR